MKVVLLMGSMKQDGNTAAVSKYFTDKLSAAGIEVAYIELAQKKINPCIGCAVCQDILDDYGCIHKDDVSEICNQIMSADAIFIATPIYSWYSTTPVKSLMDRLVYMMNKYYGEIRGGSSWSGKKMGVITTCGYPDHYGADLFITGVKRYTKHSDLIYLGNFNARDRGRKFDFMTEDVKKATDSYAEEVISALMNADQAKCH